MIEVKQRWSDPEFMHIYSLYHRSKAVDDSCSSDQIIRQTTPYWKESWEYINRLLDKLDEFQAATEDHITSRHMEQIGGLIEANKRKVKL